METLRAPIAIAKENIKEYNVVGAPRLYSLANTIEGYWSSQAQDVNDCYISFGNLRLDRVLPCIPRYYAEASVQQRALYVIGVPHSVDMDSFRELFSGFGTVDKTPAIIDLESLDTFRWLIMSTRDEASLVSSNLNNQNHFGFSLRICQALPSNRGYIVLGMDLTMDSVFGRAADDILLTEPDVPDPSLENSCEIPPKLVGVQNLLDGPDNRKKEKDTDPIKIDSPKGSKKRLRGRRYFIPLSLSPPALTKQNLLAPIGSSSISFSKAVGTYVSSTKSEDGSKEQGVDLVEECSKGPSTGAVSALIENYSPASVSASCTTSPSIPSQPLGTIVSSWAEIAASSGIESSHVKLHLSKKLVVPSTKRVENTSLDTRVVMLLNLHKSIGLPQVSRAVQEGQLVGIRFGVNSHDKSRYAGVIFRFADHAADFYNVLIGERETHKAGRFQYVVEAIMGAPFPKNSTMQAMEYPTFATRRLVLSKKAFFYQCTSEALEKLLGEQIGKQNLEELVIHNSGNASMVFAEVSAAMKIKAMMERLTAEAEVDGAPQTCDAQKWAGLWIQFAKDPCQKSPEVP